MLNKKINSQIKKYKQLVEEIEEEVRRTLLLLQSVDDYYSTNYTEVLINKLYNKE
jgi:transcription elongation factor GreA-like protein